jgi:hypothetical protein
MLLGQAEFAVEELDTKGIDFTELLKPSVGMRRDQRICNS